MSSITFRGATIKSYTSYCSTGGQRCIEIEFDAAWTKPVCNEMGWTEEPEGFGNGSLDGQLSATSMICEPNGKELKDYRFDTGVDKIGSFKHKAKVKDGEVVDRSLTFIATTTAEDAHEVLDKWLRMVGPSDSTAVVVVKYNAKEQLPLVDDKQATIPGAEPEKPRGRKKAQAVE